MVLRVGDRAPDFSCGSVVGGPFTLSDAVRDGDVLLYFYVVNYGHTCTEYIATMNERKAEFDRLGVTMYHVNPETVENHRAWMDRVDSLYDHLSDHGQRISKEYGAIITDKEFEKVLGYTNREFFLIGRDMEIRYIWRAEFPSQTIPMAELLKEIGVIIGH